GKGDAFPYNKETWKVSMVDSEKGKITIVSTPESGEAKTYDAYVDMTTGVIVRPRDASWSTVFVFLPYEWDAEKSHVEAAVLDESIAITYSKEDVTESSFVFNETAFFGVTFASDKAGENKISVTEFSEQALVYVIKGTDVIASYAKNADGEFVSADGYEGSYTLAFEGQGGSGTVIISGSGIATIVLGPDRLVKGVYTLAEEGTGYTAGAYFEMQGETQYYELVLNSDLTGTIAMPMVTVTYNLNGTGTLTETSKEFNKNVVATLTEPADTDEKKFGGWYFDAACTQPVPAEFKPTADITVYAKWSDRGSFTVVTAQGDTGVTVYFGDGDKLVDILAAHGYDFTVDVDNWRVFRGWYTDANYTQAVPTNTTLDKAESDGFTIYAKWEALPVYYGEYAGNALNTDVQFRYAATVKIDEDGVITLHRIKNSSGDTEDLTGSVIGYTEATQLLTWKVNGDDTVYKMWFDKTSGFLAFAQDKTEDVLEMYPYVVSRNGEKAFDIQSFGFHNGANKYRNPAYLISYGTTAAEKTLLIYTDMIYADVSLSDYKGDALTVNEAANSKTLVVKKGGTVVLAVGSTGTKISNTSGKDELGKDVELKLLDAHYG
ncbi:MAG: InlB B-repeat-containing protein, partial [Clostridia bacterium]|nr:InlB B-repeat-containing protein [Clostridia bacterium]